MTTFAEKMASVIRGMLAEQNVSQAALAARLHRTQSYVSERETARRYWTTADLDVIADVVGLSPADLLVEVVRRIKAADAVRPAAENTHVVDDAYVTPPSGGSLGPGRRTRSPRSAPR